MAVAAAAAAGQCWREEGVDYLAEGEEEKVEGLVVEGGGCEKKQALSDCREDQRS